MSDTSVSKFLRSWFFDNLTELRKANKQYAGDLTNAYADFDDVVAPLVPVVTGPFTLDVKADPDVKASIVTTKSITKKSVDITVFGDVYSVYVYDFTPNDVYVINHATGGAESNRITP